MKLKKIKEKLTKKEMAMILPIATTFLSLTANASDSANAVIVSSMQSVGDEIIATLSQIAPIALSVAVFGMVFKYGLRFFKSLSK